MMFRTRMYLAALAALGTLATAPAGLAHEADGMAAASATTNPATLVQLESVRRATDRFLDEQRAIDEGYVDIGVFYPNMGHHYLKAELLDEKSSRASQRSSSTPTIRAAAAAAWSPSSTRFRSRWRREAPAGFVGPGDAWVVNQRFQLWTLHAWLFEYNPAGVFAAHNVRVP